MKLRFLVKPLGLLGIIPPTGWIIYILNLSTNNEVRFTFISGAVMFAVIILTCSFIMSKKPPRPDSDPVAFRKRKIVIVTVLMLAAMLIAASTLGIFFILKTSDAL